MTLLRLEPSTRYSEAVVHQGTVYLSGQVPGDGTADDIRSQMADVLASIDRVLALANSDRGRLLTALIFLRDLDDYAGMNEVWDAWLPAGEAPCRATVQARLAVDRWRVEVVVTAAAGPAAMA